VERAYQTVLQWAKWELNLGFLPSTWCCWPSPFTNFSKIFGDKVGVVFALALYISFIF